MIDPGSGDIPCPGGLFSCAPLLPHNPLPVSIQPRGDSTAPDQLPRWLEANHTWVTDLLLKYGGVLFRGFPVDSPQDFSAIAQRLAPRLRPYTEGQSQRSRVSASIYTSTEYPSDQNITLHNELSYTKNPPQRVLFYCQVAPERGGETPIVDCRRVYQTMTPSIRDRFVERQIRYVKNMHAGKGFGKSWQDHFETTDRSVVEEYLAGNDAEYHWKPDGSLCTSQVRPATVQHPASGERVWFNQADLWHYTNIGERGETLLRLYGEHALPTNAYYGDGSPIASEALATVRRHLWQQASIFPWHRGDVLYLDNWLVAHGRRAFAGERRVLVAMA